MSAERRMASSSLMTSSSSSTGFWCSISSMTRSFGQLEGQHDGPLLALAAEQRCVGAADEEFHAVGMRPYEGAPPLAFLVATCGERVGERHAGLVALAMGPQRGSCTSNGSHDGT